MKISKKLKKNISRSQEYENRWLQNFEKLKEYKHKFGHCNVLRKDKNYPGLGYWVNIQRTNKNELSKKRLKLLNSIEFDWDPIENLWQKNFDALKKYNEKYGNTIVIRKDIPVLYRWIETQRRFRHKLPKEKISLLKSINFLWNPLDTRWEKNLKDLKDFKRSFGHCNVPRPYEPNPELANWVSTQKLKKTTLSQENRQILNNLGFCWDVLSNRWLENFQKLHDYKKENGNCNIPQVFEKDPKLGRWVHYQKKHKEKLSQEQIDKLNSVGYEWEVRNSMWEERFQELVEYKKKHGNLHITRSKTTNSRLLLWIKHQRDIKDKILKERKDRLIELGFDFDPKETFWNTMYDALLKFKIKNGNLDVPWEYKECKNLCHWIMYQIKYKKKLSPERYQKLVNIGLFA